MSFGLIGSLGTFCRLGNDLFRDYLDKFVIIYIDDLLIFSKSLEEHKLHVTQVLQRLREHKLFAKPEKCEFVVEEIEFLGFRIGREGLKMDVMNESRSSKEMAPTYQNNRGTTIYRICAIC